jgi:tape measure domain-containing protein
LTNNQLIENAKTWASYGLTTEGLTDRLRRLGTVAGGNSEKFRALTIAFAQVNAQGKLMGQEKNQLINAGMSLQSVAAAAGISMDEFADAMKNGEIRVEHLNKELIEIRSEGGLCVEAQADTLKGKMTILTSAWEEFLQALGEAEEGPAGKFLDKLIQATKSAKDIVPLAEEIDFSAGIKGDLVDALGNLPARAYAMFAGKIGREAVEDADLSSAYKAMGSGLSFLFGQAPSAGGIGMGEAFDEVFGRIANLLPGREASDIDEEIKARQDAQKRVDAALEQEAKERLRRRREIEQTILDDLSSNWDLTQQQFANALSNITKDSTVLEKAMKLFASRIFTEGGAGFVGPMPADRAIEEGSARNKQQLLDAAQFEIDVAEQEIKNANQRHKLEMELLNIKEKEVAQALAMDKKIAAGPQQKDAMFTGGSVEEFMFLRRQTQINETAKAVKEAENSAAEQRRQIEADRKAADAIRDGKIDALTTAIDQLYQEISNLND